MATKYVDAPSGSALRTI